MSSTHDIEKADNVEGNPPSPAQNAQDSAPSTLLQDLLDIVGGHKRKVDRWECNPHECTVQDLHSALCELAMFCEWPHVEKALKIIPETSRTMLTEPNVYGVTALHYVTRGGPKDLAKEIVEMAPGAPDVEDLNGMTTLEWGARWANKEVTEYLAECTQLSNPRSKGILMSHLVKADFYDIATNICRRYPDLALAEIQVDQFRSVTVLHLLVQKTSSFTSCSEQGFWESYIYSFAPVAKLKYVVGRAEGDKSDRRDKITIERKASSTRVLVSYLRFWKAMEKLVPKMKQLRDLKLKHKQADEFLKLVTAVMCLCKSDVRVEVLPILLVATRNGILEIVKACLQIKPTSSFSSIYNPLGGLHLLHVAVAYRQDKIFNFVGDVVREDVSQKKHPAIGYMDATKIMHLAAKQAPTYQLESIAGVVLQLQRELQWFKSVETLTSLCTMEQTLASVCIKEDGLNRDREELQFFEDVYSFLCKAHREKTAKQNTTNDSVFEEFTKKEGARNNHQNAREIFIEQHKELAEKGETWMKDTSNSGMVVATLIATIAFAAAITVPGGNSSDGTPTFLSKTSFKVFAISDALGLISSTTSLMMFLSILTSRFAVEDFLFVLPTKLVLGKAFLLLSVASMMVSFNSTLWIVLANGFRWILLLSILFSCIPVLLFLILQLPFYIQIIRSTYGSGIFSESKKGPVYIEKDQEGNYVW